MKDKGPYSGCNKAIVRARPAHTTGPSVPGPLVLGCELDVVFPSSLPRRQRVRAGSGPTSWPASAQVFNVSVSRPPPQLHLRISRRTPTASRSRGDCLTACQSHCAFVLPHLRAFARVILAPTWEAHSLPSHPPVPALTVPCLLGVCLPSLGALTAL